MNQSVTPPLRRRDRRAIERRDRPLDRRRTAPAQRRGGGLSPLLIVSILGILVAAVVIVLNLPKAEPTAFRDPPTTFTDDLTDGTVLGLADAPVTIELYADFQCPVCARWDRDIMPGLLGEFVRPGTVRVVARDIAFLGRGTPDESLELATGAACAAKQDRYWQFHDYVYWNQGGENRGDHDAAFIARVADAAGVERNTWDACLADDTVRDEIRAATTTALSSGIDSTPTMVIDGERISGVPAYADLASAIRALAASAVPASDAPASEAPSPS